MLSWVRGGGGGGHDDNTKRRDHRRIKRPDCAAFTFPSHRLKILFWYVESERKAYDYLGFLMKEILPCFPKDIIDTDTVLLYTTYLQERIKVERMQTFIKAAKVYK